MSNLIICPYCGEQHRIWKDKATHPDCWRAHRRNYYHNVLVPRKDAPKLPLPPDGHKRCTGCERVLPLDQFHYDKSKRDGHMARCKDCERLRGEARRNKLTRDQKQKRTAYMRVWRAQNRDHLLAWQQNYQPRHRAERVAQGKHPFLDRTAPKRYGAFRVCKGCGEKKRIDQFRAMSSGMYRSGYCNMCERERSRRYQEKNRETIKARRRARQFKRVLSSRRCKGE